MLSVHNFGTIAHGQMSSFNAHADLSIRAKGLKFGPSLYLHQYYFLYVSNEGSGESSHLRRLAGAFDVR